MKVLRFDKGIDKLTEESWSNFISNHQDGNYFQTPEYYNFIIEQKNFNGFVLIALSMKNQILGVLVGYKQYFGPKLFSRLANRIVVYGGPVVLDQSNEVAKLLIKEVNKYGGIYVEFRNLTNCDFYKNTFKDCGYDFKEHLNFLVELNKETLSNIKNDKSRQIKSSLKYGATIRKTNQIEDIKKLYFILKNLYKNKIKKPLPTELFFINLYTQNKEKNAPILFVVEYENRIIGGIFCLTFNNEIIYEYYNCGLDSEYKDVHPSVLATYAPIYYGVQNGFRIFDFLGAGKPEEDYGVRKFKSRFGGNQVAYGRFLKINSVLFYLYKRYFSKNVSKNKS